MENAILICIFVLVIALNFKIIRKFISRKYRMQEKITKEQKQRAAKIEKEMEKYIPADKEPEFRKKVNESIDKRMNKEEFFDFEIVLEETEKQLLIYKEYIKNE